MSSYRIPPSLSAASFEARSTPSSKARTLATRLPVAEMLAVEEAAKAVGQTPSAWLREAAIAHLRRPAAPKRRPLPDPTLLAEVLALRSVLVNLLSTANPQLAREAVERIVRHADSIKDGKAEEIVRRIEDGNVGA